MLWTECDVFDLRSPRVFEWHRDSSPSIMLHVHRDALRMFMRREKETSCIMVLNKTCSGTQHARGSAVVWLACRRVLLISSVRICVPMRRNRWGRTHPRAAVIVLGDARLALFVDHQHKLDPHGRGHPLHPPTPQGGGMRVVSPTSSAKSLQLP